MRRIPVLWLCGPPGVGKSVVGWEVYQRLMRAGRAPAHVDIDQLGMSYPEQAGDPGRHVLKARNLGVVRANGAAAGAQCLIVSGVVDATRGPETEHAGGGEVMVCRLRVDAAELVRRVLGRSGSSAQPDAAVQDADLLDRSTFTDWCVDTTALSVEAVADQVLAHVGDWPDATTDTGRRSWTAGDAGTSDGGEVLWLSGPTGVGTSTVGFRVYMKVLSSGIPAAYLDVDQLAFCGTASADHLLRARNLAGVWGSFRSAGARVLVAVGPVATTSDALVYEDALRGATVTWCRLHADDPELTRRVLSRRDGGSWPQPGDPLRGRPTEKLLDIAAQAVTEARRLERHGVGLRIDVSDLTADDAADTIIRRTRWPTTSPFDRGSPPRRSRSPRPPPSETS
jgi:adenylylsulfate kinase-like enzyme